MAGEPEERVWRAGERIYARDRGNEQSAPITTPGGVFTGKWKRVDQFPGFTLLYGTNQPFSMQIQFSKDGVTRDPDPFATITPQVRQALGLYTVISPQTRAQYFRPWYREVIVNGPNPQAFVVNDAILGDDFRGYYISVDGPIPILGLGQLGINVAWARGPNGWVPLAVDAAGKLDVGHPYKHLDSAGTAVLRTGPSTLKNVIINRYVTTAPVVLTLYDAATPAEVLPANVVAAVQVGLNIIGLAVPPPPMNLDYNLNLVRGLTAVLSANGPDVTVVYE